jgi:hypothetical protein
MDINKLAMYANVFLRFAQDEQARRNFYISPMTGHRQEWWVLPNGTSVDVPETHGKTAVEILKKRNVKIPLLSDGSGIPDFMAAMGIMFNEGAARVHKFGNDIVVSFNRLTSKILDGVTNLLIEHNVPLNNPIRLQNGGINNFTNTDVFFVDLLQSGNNPSTLEKIHNTRNWEGAKLAMMRFAQAVDASTNTPSITIQPGKPEANCALDILKL